MKVSNHIYFLNQNSFDSDTYKADDTISFSVYLSACCMSFHTKESFPANYVAVQWFARQILENYIRQQQPPLLQQADSECVVEPRQIWPTA